MARYIVDSSTWISYFEESQNCKAIIEENEIQTPVIVVAEVTRVLERRRVSKEVLEKALKYIFKHSLILNLDFDQAVLAGSLAEKEKLSLYDALVYSHASPDKELATRDADFKGKQYVKILE